MEKEKAVVFDLDGTLALHNDRGPYDWSKVETDLVNHPVASLYRMFANMRDMTIFFVTARPEEAYEGTVAWLEEKLGVVWDTQVLLMRETGDMRPAPEVKKEIYTTHLEPDYNVLMIFEDQQSVVDMYRGLGLTCLQVACDPRLAN